VTAYSLLDLAIASLDAGEIDEALDALDRHLIDAPDDDGYRLRAGILARLPGRAADAEDDLRRLSQPTSTDHRLRARIAVQLDDPLSAQVVLNLLWLREHDPRDAETLLAIYLRLGTPGNLTNALKLLDMLPDTWNWQIVRGDAHAGLGAIDAARAAYARALDTITLPPGDPLYAYVEDRLRNLTP